MSVTVTMIDKPVNVQPDDAFRAITAEAGRRNGFRVERPDPNTLVVIRRVTPGWAIFLAIVGLLVFLLGLLFLLVKRDERVTIIANPTGDVTRYTVTGRTDMQTARFLKGLLDPASSPAPGANRPVSTQAATR